MTLTPEIIDAVLALWDATPMMMRVAIAKGWV
jgi:hypothetical protein